MPACISAAYDRPAAGRTMHASELDCEPGRNVDQASAGATSVAAPMDLMADEPIVHEVQHTVGASGREQADENLHGADCEHARGIGVGTTAEPQQDMGVSKVNKDDEAGSGFSASLAPESEEAVDIAEPNSDASDCATGNIDYVDTVQSGDMAGQLASAVTRTEQEQASVSKETTSSKAKPLPLSPTGGAESVWTLRHSRSLPTYVQQPPRQVPREISALCANLEESELTYSQVYTATTEVASPSPDAGVPAQLRAPAFRLRPRQLKSLTSAAAAQRSSAPVLLKRPKPQRPRHLPALRDIASTAPVAPSHTRGWRPFDLEKSGAPTSPVARTTTAEAKRSVVEGEPTHNAAGGQRGANDMPTATGRQTAAPGSQQQQSRAPTAKEGRKTASEDERPQMLRKEVRHKSVILDALTMPKGLTIADVKSAVASATGDGNRWQRVGTSDAFAEKLERMRSALARWSELVTTIIIPFKRKVELWSSLPIFRDLTISQIRGIAKVSKPFIVGRYQKAQRGGVLPAALHVCEFGALRSDDETGETSHMGAGSSFGSVALARVESSLLTDGNGVLVSSAPEVLATHPALLLRVTREALEPHWWWGNARPKVHERLRAELKAKLLKRAPLLGIANYDLCFELADLFRYKNVPAAEALFLQRDAASSVCVLVHGRVVVTRSAGAAQHQENGSAFPPFSSLHLLLAKAGHLPRIGALHSKPNITASSTTAPILRSPPRTNANANSHAHAAGQIHSKKQLVAHICDGDERAWLGGIALFTRAPRTYSVTCTEPSQVLLLPREHFEAFASIVPSVVRAIRNLSRSLEEEGLSEESQVAKMQDEARDMAVTVMFRYDQQVQHKQEWQDKQGADCKARFIWSLASAYETAHTHVPGAAAETERPKRSSAVDFAKPKARNGLIDLGGATTF